MHKFEQLHVAKQPDEISQVKYVTLNVSKTKKKSRDVFPQGIVFFTCIQLQPAFIVIIGRTFLIFLMVFLLDFIINPAQF